MRKIALLTLAVLLAGCATPYNRKDPLEPLNRKIYSFNDKVDKAVLKPVAKGYDAVVPKGIRIVVGNFFSNLGDVVITINDLLQLKGKQAFSDAGRVFINTTIGFMGLVDVAGPAGYPKHNEDFGQTLGYWGIQPGPYLVLPFLGPSDFRDGVGTVVDWQYYPLYRTTDVVTKNSLIALEGVDKRADLLDSENILMQAAIDPYVFVREAYLQHRQSLVYDGNPPMEDEEDDSGE